jgi:hypothetical protein
MNQDFIQELQTQLQPARQRMVDHTLYCRIESLDDLRVFMSYHVFAVWDFMSLLKALQRDLTCVTLPWVPTGNPATRRLINEIVLEEETDVDPEGCPTSHFELYLRAMRAQAPAAVQAFVQHTFAVIEAGQPHAIAAAFTFGREDVIPDMFRNLVADLGQRFPGQLDTFIYYLNRHIELDEDHHAPLAHQMVRDLCGTDPQRWQQATAVAAQGMAARVALWDGIQAALAKVPTPA